MKLNVVLCHFNVFSQKTRSNETLQVDLDLRTPMCKIMQNTIFYRATHCYCILMCKYGKDDNFLIYLVSIILNVSSHIFG